MLRGMNYTQGHTKQPTCKYLMNINKTLLIFIVMSFIPAQVYAHGLSIQMIALGSSIFFAPFIIGLILAGEGARLWFFIVSVLFYLLIYGVVSLQNNISDIFIILFMPYLLIIIAYLKRKTVQTNIISNKDSGTDASPPVN